MPDHQPKASEMVLEIVRFIEQLIERERGVVEGDVYFRVARSRAGGCPASGPRSRSRSRTRSRRPHFALWKANKPGEDTSWDSPWVAAGLLHIECSVMAEEP